MATSPIKLRVELAPQEMEALRRAASYAVANSNDLQEAFEGQKPKLGAATFDGVLKKVTEALNQKRLLAWKDVELDGRPLRNTWDAVIGTAEDGATFTLEHVGTCYRRGKWKLFIQVHEGAKHHDWGCFDDADQPTRWYHDLGNAIAEAEAIAAVLLADRMERGPLEGWVPSAQG